MIQRMGRVVRKKKDDRLARIVVLFVEETCEDPASGAHEDFIDMIIDVSEDAHIFTASVPDGDVVEYLNRWSD